MRRTWAQAVLMVIALGGLVAGASQAKAVSYDAFCKISNIDERRQTFVSSTAANQAELVKTQLERWRDANRPTLQPVQLTLLEELIGFVTPELYAEGVTPELRTKQRTLQTKQREMFSKSQLDAMGPLGPCIAKK